jgi:hypothetical protein
MERDAAEALQACDGARQSWGERELLDLAIELVAPLQRVGEQRVVFANDEPIGGREWRGFTGEVFESAAMGRAPVGAVAKDKPASREEFENVVARLEDLALKCFATADHVAHALLGLARVRSDRGSA